MLHIQINKQNGRSMVEVIGVIGVMAILAIGALKAIDYGMGFYRAHEVKVVAEEMVKKIEQFAVWERGYDNVCQDGFRNSVAPAPNGISPICDGNDAIATFFCDPNGLNFPPSFCSGNNVNSNKLGVIRGKFSAVQFDNAGGVGRISRSATWTVLTDEDDLQHFVLVFRVGREACRQLRRSSGGRENVHLRQVAPLNHGGIGTTFCSKFFPNQFVVEYP